jgi:uncharacterized protein GlcG (DUF336 family)
VSVGVLEVIGKSSISDLKILDFRTFQDAFHHSISSRFPGIGLGRNQRHKWYWQQSPTAKLHLRPPSSKIITNAVANATALNIPQNIAIVNPSGLLVAFYRMDNAFIGLIDLSQKKARTAVLINGLTSGDLYATVQPGAPLYGIENNNGGMTVFAGGYPIYLNGKLIRGVGVSGGTDPQDIKGAQAGILAIGASFTQPS